jgi:hypothetical protein
MSHVAEADSCLASARRSPSLKLKAAPQAQAACRVSLYKLQPKLSLP